jgi:hypothetical protein
MAQMKCLCKQTCLEMIVHVKMKQHREQNGDAPTRQTKGLLSTERACDPLFISRLVRVMLTAIPSIVDLQIKIKPDFNAAPTPFLDELFIGFHESD